MGCRTAPRPLRRRAAGAGPLPTHLALPPRRRMALAALLLAAAAPACGDGAAFDWRPSPDTAAALPPAEVARVDALLREVFGTALAPAPLTPPALVAHGVDLAAPDFARTSAALRAAVRADNERRFGDVLDALQSGDEPEWPDELDRDPAVHSLRANGGAADPRALADAVRDARPSLPDAARLYARQCLSCHGREGGGDGPMRPQLRPPPRDFRAGSEFQRFRPDLGARPSQEELVHVIHGGIPGTGMPSFRTFASAQLARLADLVRLLALRGEVERRLVVDVAAGRAIDRERALEHLTAAAAPWLERDEAPAAAAPAVAPRVDATPHSSPPAVPSSDVPPAR